MICKVSESDVEADDLMWQTLGSNNATVPAARRPVIAAPAGDTGGRPAPGHQGLDAIALQRLLAEMEARQPAELEKVRKSAFEHGLKQGRQEASTEMQDALDRLARTIHEVVQMKRKIRTESEHELVKLSLAVARRILHRELTADPQALRGVVYAALQRLQNRETTRIRVFPASVPAVRDALERNGGLAGIEIVADGLLQPGGLLFETSLGDLDASVETQLQEIERGFADRLQLR
jgi:flagellar assembly protein FliH